MDIYSEIRNMFLIKNMSERRIARELHISRTTVAKYRNGDVYPGIRASYHRASSVITPDVMDFIQQCLLMDQQERNPKQRHTARRIYTRLVEELGFNGSESHIRKIVHQLRGTFHTAYVPLAFEAGEAMQIDWGTYEVYWNEKKTKINVFCASLCFSCAPFILCFQRQNTESFLEGIIQALAFFGGVPRRIIFDNARVAVKKGYGKNAIPQKAYQALAGHYCFETVFCNAASGNEKGLVENLVGWARRNFFVPRPVIQELSELNTYLRDKCVQYASTHKIQGRHAAIRELLQEEKGKLLPLPGISYDTSRTICCRVSPSGTVRVDTNNYSVPIERAGQAVTVKAHAEKIAVYFDGNLIAEHSRCYGHNEEILILSHYLSLLERKPRSILQARPVKNNVSAPILSFMEENHFSSHELMDILKDYVEKGEQQVWKNRSHYLLTHNRPVSILDQVRVEAVDLGMYDCLLHRGGDENVGTKRGGIN